VVQHAAYFGLAAEQDGNTPLPPAWEDRGVNDPFPVDVFEQLATKTIAVCDVDERPLVQAWFEQLQEEYTNDEDEFTLTPARWDTELRIYTT
jgi:hypothetical protein